MKSEHPESAYRRETIARLLRGLRTLRRSRLSREEALGRLSQLQAEVGPAFEYVRIKFSPGTEPEGDKFSFVLDKTLLQRAELKQRVPAPQPR